MGELAGVHHVALSVNERGVAGSGVVDTPFGGMLHFTDPDGIALALFWNR